MYIGMSSATLLVVLREGGVRLWGGGGTARLISPSRPVCPD